MATIDQVLKLFAQPIFAKMRALKWPELKLSPRQQARLRISISEDIKSCGGLLFPDLISPKVSKAAKREADRIGVVAIHTMGWQSQKDFDPGRKTFHWEHFTPVSTIQELCEKANSEEDVFDVLRRHLQIVWILKREDEELTRLGFRSKRPDPHKAYLDAEIELLPS